MSEESLKKELDELREILDEVEVQVILAEESMTPMEQHNHILSAIRILEKRHNL